MKTYLFECANCGKTFVAHKSNAKTCSINCRVSKSYREKYGNTIVLNSKGVQQEQLKVLNDKISSKDVERSTPSWQNNLHNVEHQTSHIKTLNTISVDDILREQEKDGFFFIHDLPENISYDGLIFSKFGYINIGEVEKLLNLKKSTKRTIWTCFGFTDNQKDNEKPFTVIYINTNIYQVSCFIESLIRALDTFKTLNTDIYMIKSLC